MATGTDKVKAKLAALTASFDDLETLLEPLLAQTLPETLVGLEPIQQAKLQTILPYLVYDLIFSASLSQKPSPYHKSNVKCLPIVNLPDVTRFSLPHVSLSNVLHHPPS